MAVPDAKDNKESKTVVKINTFDGLIIDKTDLSKKTCILESSTNLGDTTGYHFNIKPSTATMQDEEDSLYTLRSSIRSSRYLKIQLLSRAGIKHVMTGNTMPNIRSLLCMFIENRIADPQIVHKTLIGKSDKPLTPIPKDAKITFQLMTTNAYTSLLSDLYASDGKFPTDLLNPTYIVMVEQQQSILDEALKPITTIFYSSKQRRLITESEMEKYKSPFNHRLRFDTKKFCEHFKLRHIDVYILGPELEAMLSLYDISKNLWLINNLPRSDHPTYSSGSVCITDVTLNIE